MIYRDITQTIGSTPIVRLNSIKDKNIYVKLEGFNPGGSVKDRAVFNMLSNITLDKDQEIVEATSGNTGIALAMICAARGIKLTIIMPENMSVERQKLIKAYGANLILTPKALGMRGATDLATEMLEQNENMISLNQFSNIHNPEAHYQKTAEEIYNDFGDDLDYFVAGVGTGGTITGCGHFLKEKNPNLKIIGVEPEESKVLKGEKPQPHAIQGIGPNFIPKNFDSNIVDQIIDVNSDEAIQGAKYLMSQEGISSGISGGAALSGALKIDAPTNSNILVIIPDSSEKYFSTPLFE